MMCETAQNRGLKWRGNADGLPLQWEEVDFSCKYFALLVFDAMWRAESIGK